LLIKMKRTEKGSPDGIKVYEYKAGFQYNINEKLRNIFISIDACEDILPERKAMTTPKNKMVKGSEDNKEAEAKAEKEKAEKEKAEKEQAEKEKNENKSKPLNPDENSANASSGDDGSPATNNRRKRK